MVSQSLDENTALLGPKSFDEWSVGLSNAPTEQSTAIAIPPHLLQDLFTHLWMNVTAAESERGEYVQRVRDNRLLFRAQQPRINPPWSGACELVVPLLKTARATLVAKIMRMLFGQSPTVVLNGKGALHLLAEASERYLDELLRVMGAERQIEPVAMHAFTDSWCGVYTRMDIQPCVRHGWGDPVVDPETQQATRPPVVVGMVGYNYPYFQPMPVDRMGAFPASEPDVQRASGVYFKTQLTGAELRAMALEDHADMQAVMRLATEGSLDTQNGVQQEQRDAGFNAASMLETRFLAEKFDIEEYYFRFTPSEAWTLRGQLSEPTARVLAAGEPVDWLMIVHPTSCTVLCCIPNPWWHGERPASIVRPYPAEQGLWGDSLADFGGAFQAAETAITRIAFDGAAEKVAPELLVDSNLPRETLDAAGQSAGPGGARPVPNLQDLLKSMQYASPGIEPNAILPFMQHLQLMGESALMLSETELGQKSSGDTTAYEIEQRLAEAKVPFQMMVGRIADGLENAMRQVLALSYQFQDEPSLQAVWNAVNPPNEEDPKQTITMDAALSHWAEYEYVMAGTTAAANKAQRAANMKAVYMTLAPHVLSQTPDAQYALAHDLLKQGFGLKEKEIAAYIGKPEEAEQRIGAVVAEMQQAAQASVQAMGGSGGDANGAA